MDPICSGSGPGGREVCILLGLGRWHVTHGNNKFLGCTPLTSIDEIQLYVLQAFGQFICTGGHVL
jgi:hypothetical protein